MLKLFIRIWKTKFFINVSDFFMISESLFLTTGVNGEPLKFLNALDITHDGIVYFTDSSKKWDRRNYRYEVGMDTAE